MPPTGWFVAVIISGSDAFVVVRVVATLPQSCLATASEPFKKSSAKCQRVQQSVPDGQTDRAKQTVLKVYSNMI